MKRYFFLLILLCLWQTGHSANTVSIAQGGTVTFCSGDFYDSDSTGNYGNNENFTITIQAPGPPNTHINMIWNMMDIDPGDTLYIYDGPNTGSPLIGKYNNNHLPGSFTAASVYNASGALTFRFVSNGVGIGAGWWGSFLCEQPCQRVIAAIDTILCSPRPNDSNYIDICKGDTIRFAALGMGPGVFPDNNYLYHQDTSSTLFIWDFGDGTVDTGRVINHFYQFVRGYDVTLTIFDTIHCHNNNALGLRVRISSNPFGVIHPIPDICSSHDTSYITLGYNSSSVVTVNPVHSIQSASQKFDSTMFIPDGPNCPPGCYNTNVTFNQFAPGLTITSGADILSVVVDIEHSFAGDLGFTLFCPNGQSVVLDANDHSGGSYLGEPYGGNSHETYDNGCNPANNPAGVGWVYGWSQIYPQQGSLNVLDAGVSPIPAADTINNTGYFTPDQPFSNLIGCPLNGTWNIQICDNWAIDNGYIFMWELNLDPHLLPVGWSYSVPIDTVVWTGSFFSVVNDSTIRIIPDSGGTYQYTVTLTDVFGCSYDTTLTLQVVQTPKVNLGPDTTICEGQTYTLHAGFGYDHYIWSTGSNVDSISISTPGSMQYWVIADNYNLAHTLTCTDMDTVTVKVLHLPVLDLGPDLCINVDTTLDALNPYSYIHYHWNTGDTTETVHVNTNTYYSVTVFEELGHNCQVTSDINILHLPFIDLGHDTCLYAETTLDALNDSPYFHYNWSTPSGSDTNQIVHVDQTGNYSVTVYQQLGHNCQSSSDINISIFPKLNFNIGPDSTICRHQSIRIVVNDETGHLADYPYQYSWSPFPSEYPYLVLARLNPNIYPIIFTAKGCPWDVVSDTMMLTVLACALQIPNVFTPNGDGSNETFYVPNLEYYPNSQFIVYNRWGKKIYENNDYKNDWDGGKFADGVYYFILRVNYGDSGLGQQIEEHHGTVTILR